MQRSWPRYVFVTPVHCLESADTGPVLKIVPLTSDIILQVTRDQSMCASLFPHPLLVRDRRRLVSLLDSNMQRSWPRYVFVTPQGTGLILPCLTLLPLRVFSTTLVKWVVMYCSNGYLRQYVCVCMGVCALL